MTANLDELAAQKVRGGPSFGIRAFKIALCVAASTLTLLPPFKNGNVCGSEIFF
jgi:hypothetical protein